MSDPPGVVAGMWSKGIAFQNQGTIEDVEVFYGEGTKGGTWVSFAHYTDDIVLSLPLGELVRIVHWAVMEGDED